MEPSDQDEVIRPDHPAGPTKPNAEEESSEQSNEEEIKSDDGEAEDSERLVSARNSDCA